ncbi:MAG: type IVB secretion system protein IcmH/DotU [Gammaproteobacteria bacterium]|nr:type IVB secretion system protein IcmH/DotU [Gammaproteobacteria bacterium]
MVSSHASEQKLAVLSTEQAISELTQLHAMQHVNQTTRLLLSSQLLTHLPEVGVNPLVDEAADLFSFMGHLKHLRECHSLEKLHQALIEKIQAFQQSILVQRYHPDQLAEYNTLCCYALCATLDGIISHAPWCSEEQWQANALVPRFVANPPSASDFFIILERMVRDPAIYIDVIEFMYLCLSFGMKMDNASGSEFNHEQLEHIMHALYQRIRSYRGHFSKTLSPFPIKSQNPQTTRTTRRQKSFSIKNTLRSLKQRFGKKQLTLTDLTAIDHDILKSKFQTIVDYLDKTKIRKNNTELKLNQLPAFLFVGGEHAGKSTLLANTKINYILSKKSLQNNYTPHMTTVELSDWWITPENIIIDVPGKYIHAIHSLKSPANMHWEGLLDLLKTNANLHPMNGIVFAIALPELMHKEQRAQLLKNIKYCLNSVHTHLGHLPFYFVITKCDLIPGFVEFFSDCSSEEFLQAWGVTVPPSSDDEFLSQIVSKRLDALIKRLNTQLIWRLHKERNAYAKFYIKNFPIQIERLKQAINGLMHDLEMSGLKCLLRGIYLTSATQEDESRRVQPPEILPGKELQQRFQLLHPQGVSKNAYFIKQFIMQGLVT